MGNESNFERAERLFEALHAHQGLTFALFDQIDPHLAQNPRLDHKAQAIHAAMSRYQADIKAVADEMLQAHRAAIEAVR